METRYKKIYVEWWKISRSTVYGLIAFVIVVGGIVFGSWYAIKHNLFTAEAISEAPKDAVLDRR